MNCGVFKRIIYEQICDLVSDNFALYEQIWSLGDGSYLIFADGKNRLHKELSIESLQKLLLQLCEKKYTKILYGRNSIFVEVEDYKSIILDIENWKIPKSFSQDYYVIGGGVNYHKIMKYLHRNFYENIPD